MMLCDPRGGGVIIYRSEKAIWTNSIHSKNTCLGPRPGLLHANQFISSCKQFHVFIIRPRFLLLCLFVLLRLALVNSDSYLNQLVDVCVRVCHNCQNSQNHHRTCKING